jgi:hypothetical protein
MELGAFMTSVSGARRSPLSRQVAKLRLKDTDVPTASVRAD